MIAWAGRASAVLLVALLACASVAGAAHGEENTEGTLTVRTVPATPGARVATEGRVVTADSRGVARLPVSDFAALDDRFRVLETMVTDDKKVNLDRIVGSPSQHGEANPLVVGLQTQRLVRWEFVDRSGVGVPVDDIELMELRNNIGEVVRLKGDALGKPRWMASGRTQQTSTGLRNKDLYWSVVRVVVDGADVVHRGQQVFIPADSRDWRINLLFYRVKFVGRDLLFGRMTGQGVALERPDGVVVRVPFSDGTAQLESLARGTYQVRIYGSGWSFTRPVNISRDSVFEIEVITRGDMVLIAAVILLLALSLVLVGRRQHVSRLRRRAAVWATGRRSRTRMTTLALAGLVGLGTMMLAVGPLPRAAAAEPHGGVQAQQPPTFAYYYIWYQPTSWLRAKKDYPLLGRYSSDDAVVMGRHVSMARAAGLDGFLVSWKRRPDLDRRLDALVALARRQDFKLAIVYQGLDFERNPLPVDVVRDDLRYFAERFGRNPVFDTFRLPVVVITGTERYTVAQLRRATAPVRGQLQVLASAKSVEDYRRTAEVMDGDAYYWSSAHPDRAFYGRKLRALGRAVREDDGLWLAPAAAGFDARMIGGRQVIHRKGGETLRRSLAEARASSPDAVAVISWNEFSENSHVEPSEEWGTETLAVLAEELGGTVQTPPSWRSTAETKHNSGLTGWGALVALLLATAALNLTLALRRRRADPDRAARSGHLPHTSDASTSSR
jgi:hypothetical protein